MNLGFYNDNPYSTNKPISTFPKSRTFLLGSQKALLQNSKERRKNEKGFVLVATLALLALAVATVVVVTSLIQMQTDVVEAQTNQAIARQNALAGLDIAIGQLQLETGHDRVVTAPAATLMNMDFATDTGNFWWTRSIDTTNGRQTWLVSSGDSSIPDPRIQIDTGTAVTLVGAGSANASDPSQVVTVEKVSLQTLPNKFSTSTETTGYYAYWTGELNTRANIAITDQTTDNLSDPYQRSANQLSIPRRTALEAIFPEITDPDENSTSELISKFKSDQQLFYLHQNRDQIRDNYHHFTTASKSVLSDPLNGGLKINLTDITYTDATITPELRAAINPLTFTNNGPQNFQVQGDKQSTSFPVAFTPSRDDPIILQQPIITGFALSMGIFHTQSDRRHRIRYHMHVEWLNPYPYDMGFSNERAFVVVVDNLPELEIINETSGDSFIVDLNDFDEDMSSNTDNETKINSWMEFDRLSSRSGTGFQYGIDAGRVYRMSEPDVDRQPRGLARTIQEDPNRWRWGGSSPPATGPRPAGYIYASDRIRIRSTSSATMNLKVIPLYDGGSIPYSTDVDAFAANKGLVTRIENIPFGAININISGSAYSRSTSGSFNPNDYRLAFHFKLKEDPATLQALGNSLLLRNPVIDLANSEIRALYEVKDVAAAARTSNPESDQENFWDYISRANTNNPSSEHFQFSLYDVPITEPTSPGVFAQVHFHDRPHPWVGSSNAEAATINSVYDRYYFSGSRISANWPAAQGNWELDRPPTGLVANHLIEPQTQSDGSIPQEQQVVGQNGAAYSLQRGGFNILSASPQAWRAFLKNQFLNNSALSISSNSTGSVVPNVFSRLPFGASHISGQVSDARITNPTEKNQILYRQGIRSLEGLDGNTDEWIDLLADAIRSSIRLEIDSYDPANFPLSSVSDFINSGAVDRAIQDPLVQINGQSINNLIDPLSPGYLRQADIFSLLGQQMKVRSDTFVIRSYGEATHSRSGRTRAKAYCEAIVQRIPNYMNPNDPAQSPASDATNIILGRRYKVVSFRWLQPYEI